METVAEYLLEGITSVVILVELVTLYGRLWCLDRKQQTRVETHTGGQQTTSVIHMKATKTVSCILMAYLVIWTPRIALKVCDVADYRSNTFQVLMLFSYDLGLCNSWLNFLIYAKTSSEFSQACKNILC